MELDSIKTIFLQKVQSSVMDNNALEIQKILRRKTSSPIYLLKRNLQLELILCLLFSIFPVFILIKYQGMYISVFAVLTLLVICNFTLRIGRILRSIHRFQVASNAVKQHLQLLINILNKFYGLYLQSTMIMLPLFFVSALLLIHLDNLEKDPLFFQTTYKTSLLWYAATFVAWSVMMYFFTKWYLNNIYGKHLHKLVQLLREVTDN